MAHTQAHEWQAAADAFEQALALHAAPTIRYNLAAAWVELGRYRDAVLQLDTLDEDAETPANVRELSRALRERIETQAGRIRVETAADTAGAQVTLDGEALDATWLTREIPVAPGAHTVAAVRDGASVAEAEVVVDAGEAARVRLGLAASREPDPITASVPLEEDWRFWLAVGGGAVALAIIVSIIAVAASSGGSSDAVPGNFVPAVITW